MNICINEGLVLFLLKLSSIHAVDRYIVGLSTRCLLHWQRSDERIVLFQGGYIQLMSSENKPVGYYIEYSYSKLLQAVLFVISVS